MAESSWIFIVNGTTLNSEPQGWIDSSIKYEWDKVLNGLFPKFPDELRFGKDGYTLLRRLYDTRGWTERIPFVIKYKRGTVETVYFRGAIFLCDIKWEYDKPEAVAKIADDTIAGRITGQKDTKYLLSSGLSQNSVDISDRITTILITFFDPATGNLLADDRLGISIYHAFNVLVGAMTDGEALFRSDFFSSLGGDFVSDYILFNGAEVRIFSNTLLPFISFQQLMEFCIAKFNCVFALEYRGDTPVIRVEPESYFFQAGTALTLGKPSGIVESVDTDKLHSRIRTGSRTHISEGSLFDIPWLTHKEEEFSILQDAGNGQTKDLSVEFVISSNVIEYVVVTDPTDDQYDEETFAVQTIGNAAQKCDIYNDNNIPWVYNRDFLNGESIKRFFQGFIPASVAQQLGDGNDVFSAYKSTTSPHSLLALTTFTQTGDFDTETTDPNGNFNNTVAAPAYAYTAPTTGLYRFFSRLVIFKNMSGFFVVQVKFIHKRGVATINEFLTDVTQNGTGQFQFELDQAIYMDGGDFVYVQWVIQEASNTLQTFRIIQDLTLFECTATTNGGGVYETFNPADFPIVNFDFSYPVRERDRRTILRNIYKAIEFTARISNREKDIEGWIESMDISNKTGMVKFKLRKGKPLRS